MAEKKLWTREELILAFNLYLKLPFGKMHKHTPEIIELANLIERTPSSIGMRLGNFASVDPYHQERGVGGLKGGMNQVKPIWDEFFHNQEELVVNAPKILKKIRYKYFSDTLVKMYKLLELYFSKSNKVSIQNKNEDFIMVKYYHLIFEDMIDKLITSKIDTKETSKGVSLKKLKENKDGKIIDHLFEYDSLIDRDESIFYIGDSKYYKTNNEVQENSIYKQFTYAKNVIQFNIDLLNEGKKINNNIRYRDKVTEGYNFTPNFFIQGIVTDIFDFDDDKLAIDFDKGIKHSYHFKERIFDRDSLFVNHYSINFLFVLKSYTYKSSFELEKYRVEIHKKFRTNFVSYLKKQNLFKFYHSEFESKELLKQFIDTEFRNLTGRVYISKSNDKRLIFAINISDVELMKKITFKFNYLERKMEAIFSKSDTEKFVFSQLKLF